MHSRSELGADGPQPFHDADMTRLDDDDRLNEDDEKDDDRDGSSG